MLPIQIIANIGINKTNPVPSIPVISGTYITLSNKKYSAIIQIGIIRIHAIFLFIIPPPTFITFNSHYITIAKNYIYYI